MSTSGKLSEATKAIIDNSPQLDTKYTLITFNKDYKTEISNTNYSGLKATTTNLTNINPGTNIRKALDAAGNSGPIILLSDGLPSYDSDGCYYPDSFEMSEIANLTTAQETRNRQGGKKLRASGNAASDIGCNNRRYGYAIAQLMEFSGSPIYAVHVKASRESNPDILKYLGKNGGYYDTDKIADAIKSAITDICTPSQPISSGGSGRIFSSLVIANNHPTKVVTGINLSLCNKQRSNCTDESKSIKMENGGIFGINTVFRNLSSNESYWLSCQLTYQDGATTACGDSQLSTNSAHKQVVNIEASGSVSTETKKIVNPLDINADGAVNALDYALVITHYGVNNQQPDDVSSLVTGDVNIDDTVDAADLSLIISNF